MSPLVSAWVPVMLICVIRALAWGSVQTPACLYLFYHEESSSSTIESSSHTWLIDDLMLQRWEVACPGLRPLLSVGKRWSPNSRLRMWKSLSISVSYSRGREGGRLTDCISERAVNPHFTAHLWSSLWVTKRMWQKSASTKGLPVTDRVRSSLIQEDLRVNPLLHLPMVHGSPQGRSTQRAHAKHRPEPGCADYPF